MAGYSSHNLEAFVDTVKLKSFSSVARKRGLTASSITRQISSLEEELGVALFIRTTRSLVLTEAGRLLFERAEEILGQLEEAKREAISLRRDVRGCLRLCCWPTFAKRCILPHLPEFYGSYPELRIDLDLSERFHDPVLERTDLVIRIGELSDSSLLSIRLATQRSLVVASPSYLSKYGEPKTLEDCAHHRLIDKRHVAAFMGWRTLLGESRKQMKQFVLQTDDLDLQAQACAAGIGLAYGPRWVFQHGLREGTLTTISIKDLEEQQAPIYLLRNPGTPTAAIEMFSNFLRTKLSKATL